MGTETRHLAEERVGTQLAGKWFLDALLGYGGSAAVYAATHRNGKRAAVKVLHPHCVADEQLRTRFVREGYVANKIGHSGAVSVLDDDTTPDGTPYLVMELLEGTSLERLGRGNVPIMSLAETIRIANDLLDVLAKAHEVGVVHRDIKPANLFVTNEGQLKVLDFGIARLSGGSPDGATQTGLMMGTPAFMPPEQARARWNEVDARSDLWAVGATMIALLLGRRPRIAETSNEELLLAMTEPMPPVMSLLPNAPPTLAVVIDRAVAFNREDRWPNARAMQEAIRHSIAGLDQSTWGQTLVRSGAPEPIISTTVLHHTAQIQSAPPPHQQPYNNNNNMMSVGGAPIVSPMAMTAASSSSDLEQAPSLTTSRAVLHSAPPSAVTGHSRKSSASSTAFVMFALLLATGIVGGGLLYARSRNMHHAAISATPPSPPATMTAAATVAAATEPAPVATEAVPAPPPTTASVAASSSAIAATNNTKPKPVALPRPQGSASASPAKYFDSRF